MRESPPGLVRLAVALGFLTRPPQLPLDIGAMA